MSTILPGERPVSRPNAHPLSHGGRVAPDRRPKRTTLSHGGRTAREPPKTNYALHGTLVCGVRRAWLAGSLALQGTLVLVVRRARRSGRHALHGTLVCAVRGARLAGRSPSRGHWFRHFADAARGPLALQGTLVCGVRGARPLWMHAVAGLSSRASGLHSPFVSFVPSW